MDEARRTAAGRGAGGFDRLEWGDRGGAVEARMPGPPGEIPPPLPSEIPGPAPELPGPVPELPARPPEVPGPPPDETPAPRDHARPRAKEFAWSSRSRLDT